MIQLPLLTFLLALFCIAVAWIDIRTGRIPNLLNAAIGVSGLAATWFLSRDFGAALIGALVGYAALALLNWAYRRRRGQDGIGMGDAKFLAGAGAWLGWQPLPFVVLVAAATGLAWVAWLRVRGRALNRLDRLAFGPFLSAAVFVCWLAVAYP